MWGVLGFWSLGFRRRRRRIGRLRTRCRSAVQGWWPDQDGDDRRLPRWSTPRSGDRSHDRRRRYPQAEREAIGWLGEWSRWWGQLIPGVRRLWGWGASRWTRCAHCSTACSSARSVSEIQRWDYSGGPLRPGG